MTTAGATGFGVLPLPVSPLRTAMPGGTAPGALIRRTSPDALILMANLLAACLTWLCSFELATLICTITTVGLPLGRVKESCQYEI
jgi:hypothetical protein